jgi:hypothetical protein
MSLIDRIKSPGGRSGMTGVTTLAIIGVVAFVVGFFVR